jgi:hypothetical protein
VYILGKEQSIDRDVKSIKNTWIVAKYSTKCVRCGKQLGVGEMVYWIRITYSDNSMRSFVYCGDCYMNIFDVSLAKRYIKKKNLSTQSNH